MQKRQLRTISYARDCSVQADKFVEFDRMVKHGKRDADAVLIASPEVLGDTFEELIDNLDKLAAAELLLVIVPPSERAAAKKPLN